MTLFANTYSRFQSTRTVLQDGEEVWGAWNQPFFIAEKLPQNQQMAVRIGSDREGRPDLISQDLYGTTKLDWMLIAFNNAIAVFNWPRSGTVISAPLSDIVLGEVL